MKYLYLLITLLFMSCIFSENHDNNMSDDDISWITHYYIGDTIYYISNKDSIDTMVVRDVYIDYNKMWSIIDFDRRYYCTLSNVDLELKHLGENADLFFCIQRINKTEPLYTGYYIGEWFLPDAQHIPLKTITYTINNKKYKNCHLINTDNMEGPESDDVLKDLKTVVWNKELGILQYTFKDSTIYTMKGL